MGKVSWDKDQREKAKEMKLPLVSMAYDGGTLPKNEDGRYRMTIDGPVPPKFLKRFQEFMNEFIRAMADRNVDRPKRSKKRRPVGKPDNEI